MIKVLVFAGLKEAVGAEALQLALNAPISVLALKQAAAAHTPAIAQLQQQGTLTVAVNHTIASDELLIQATDEVAMFPPVTGG